MWIEFKNGKDFIFVNDSQSDTKLLHNKPIDKASANEPFKKYKKEILDAFLPEK